MQGFVKTRVGIAIAGILFLLLVFVMELSPLQDLFGGDAITRSGVAKFRIHILSTPVLDKLENKLTSLNSTVDIEQLSGSDYFYVDGGHGHHAYFKLTAGHDFERAGKMAGSSNEHVELPPDMPVDIRLGDEDGKPVLLKNDSPLLELPESSKNGKFAVFNKEKSALVASESSIHLIADLDKPSLKTIDCRDKIVDLSVDREGARIFVLVKKADNAGKKSEQGRRTLKVIDLESNPDKIEDLKIPVSFHSRIFYNHASLALLILDKEKIRILDAQDGSVRLIRNFTKEPPLEEQDVVVLSGVPAAILKEAVVDLRPPCEEVGTLIGFGSQSRYVIDFRNKRFYYSGQIERDQKDQKEDAAMSIASYDLNKLTLEKQVKLAGRSASEESTRPRLDFVKAMFLDKDGNLVALSAPK
ncbi:MAG: hypothetical protein KC777_17125 [Cyanobacteria bacterium HKST-UBA02]|nr:hypothetical protein [Cyanobacteria bacterium HKST-UBA02]